MAAISSADYRLSGAARFVLRPRREASGKIEHFPARIWEAAFTENAGVSSWSVDAQITGLLQPHGEFDLDLWRLSSMLIELEANQSPQGQLRAIRWFVLVASSISEKSADAASTQHRAQRTQRVIGRPFKPGQSGNPKGDVRKAQRAAIEARRVELLAAIIADCGELNRLEHAFAEQAAVMLARASVSRDGALAVRLTNSASKTVAQIKASIAARNTGPKKTAFDLYVEKMKAEGSR